MNHRQNSVNLSQEWFAFRRAVTALDKVSEHTQSRSDDGLGTKIFSPAQFQVLMEELERVNSAFRDLKTKGNK
jgi:hypothetical protein